MGASLRTLIADEECYNELKTKTTKNRNCKRFKLECLKYGLWFPV